MSDSKLEKIRFYYLYSWWIFVWFVLYKLNIVKYEPSYASITAVLFDVLMSIYFICKPLHVL